MSELEKLIQKVEALLQQETDPTKRWKYRMVIAETIRRFEQLKSA